jgi:hypothetical protein
MQCAHIVGQQVCRWHALSVTTAACVLPKYRSSNSGMLRMRRPSVNTAGGQSEYERLENVKRHFVAVVVAVLPCTGCLWTSQAVPPPVTTPSPTETAVPDPQADAAAQLAARVDWLTQVEGRFEDPDGASRFVGFFDDGQLCFLIEQVDGVNSATINEYFFENGRLFYYAEDRRVVTDGDAGALTLGTATLRLSFDPDGVLLRNEKSIDGLPALATDPEVLAVRVRADLLRLTAEHTRRRVR